MKIRSRLTISFLLVFIIPCLMTLGVVIFTLGGLWVFIHGGNHIAVESPQQFENASSIVELVAKRAIRHDHAKLSELDQVLRLLSPEGNYISILREGEPLYAYGNIDLLPMTKEVSRRIDTVQKTGSLRVIDGRNFYFMDNVVIRHVPYTIYYVARQAPSKTDRRFEEALSGTIKFDIFSLIIFVLAVSWFFSKFIVSHMILPLEKLRKGASEIQKGNLMIRLEHKENDEFKPVFTAFNRMAKELHSSLEKQQREEENRKELMASISHDIRTPLTAIKAYVEGLTDGVANTPDKQQRYLKVISEKTDVLDRMIDQLFLFSKMDVGEKAVPLTPLLLKKEVEKWKDTAPYSEASVIMTYDLEDAGILGNSLLIDRILDNLVSNSLKYKTEEKAHIAISVKQDKDTVLLQVQDDGPGVSPEALAHLSEPFYRTDKARSRTENGSGLGLSIVKRAVALMHGTVTFSLAQPHGLICSMAFPLKEDSHEPESIDR